MNINLPAEVEDWQKKASIYYSKNNRLLLFSEEVAELFIAINHLMRGRADAVINVLEELIDVNIVGGQILEILEIGDDIAKGVIKEKIKKMVKQIQEDIGE